MLQGDHLEYFKNLYFIFCPSDFSPHISLHSPIRSWFHDASDVGARVALRAVPSTGISCHEVIVHSQTVTNTVSHNLLKSVIIAITWIMDETLHSTHTGSCYVVHGEFTDACSVTGIP